MRQLFFLLSLVSLLATACGRKGPLIHLPDEKRPNFDYVSDELDSDKNGLQNKIKKH